MIYFIKGLSTILVTYGFYRSLLFLFRIPSIKIYKMAHRLTKVNKNAGALSLFIQNFAISLSKKINLNESKKLKLKSMLRYYDEDINPDIFVAQRITNALLFIAPAVILYFIFPILSIVLIFIAIISYFHSGLKLEQNYHEKIQEIEYELPRFCAAITQEIKTGHDILGILERYVLTSDKALKKELEVTIADMKSSNYEAALVRLESRLSMGSVSDIIRGLIGVARGDEMKSYFEMLSHNLDATELQRLEDEAAKQPQKIKKYQFLILVAMMIMYFATIAVYLFQMDKPTFL